MRSFFVATVICAFVATALLGSAQAAGTYVAGKEEGDRSSLSARGVIPDTLNKVSHAFPLAFIGRVIDRIAGEVKAILGQFGIQTRPHVSAPGIAPATGVKSEPEQAAPKKRRIKFPPKAN